MISTRSPPLTPSPIHSPSSTDKQPQRDGEKHTWLDVGHVLRPPTTSNSQPTCQPLIIKDPTPKPQIIHIRYGHN